MPRLAVLYDRLFRTVERRLVRTTTNGFTMYVDPEDFGVARPLLQTGVYEPEETSVVRRIARPGAIVIDIGANIGYYTLLAAGLVGSAGRVFAFEPESHNYRILEKNVAENALTNVTLERMALSDRPGFVFVEKDLVNYGGHHIADTRGAASSEKAPAMQLDAYVVERSIDAREIAFIKMDVEGAEPRVLNGMEDTVRLAGDNLLILTEYAPDNLRRASQDPPAYLKALRALNFELWSLDGTPLDDAEIIAHTQHASFVNILAGRGSARRLLAPPSARR